jgi:hypothetical protein
MMRNLAVESPILQSLEPLSFIIFLVLQNLMFQNCLYKQEF